MSCVYQHAGSACGIHGGDWTETGGWLLVGLLLMGLDSINLTLTQCVWHFPQSWGLALLSDNAISFQIFPLLKKKKKKKARFTVSGWGRKLHSAMWDSGRRLGEAETSHQIDNDTQLNHPPPSCMFISSVFIIFVSVWIHLYGKYSYCIQVANTQTTGSKPRDFHSSLDFYSQFLCPYTTSVCPVLSCFSVWFSQ